jgi:hypothetical protein
MRYFNSRTMNAGSANDCNRPSRDPNIFRILPGLAYIGALGLISVSLEKPILRK